VSFVYFVLKKYFIPPHPTLSLEGEGLIRGELRVLRGFVVKKLCVDIFLDSGSSPE
jgi:hypothetical protein